MDKQRSVHHSNGNLASAAILYFASKHICTTKLNCIRTNFRCMKIVRMSQIQHFRDFIFEDHWVSCSMIDASQSLANEILRMKILRIASWLQKLASLENLYVRIQYVLSILRKSLYIKIYIVDSHPICSTFDEVRVIKVNLHLLILSQLWLQFNPITFMHGKSLKHITAFKRWLLY